MQRVGCQTTAKEDFTLVRVGLLSQLRLEAKGGGASHGVELLQSSGQRVTGVQVCKGGQPKRSTAPEACLRAGPMGSCVPSPNYRMDGVRDTYGEKR